MVLFIGFIVGSAMANYQPQEGRWMQQEKLGTMPDSGSVNPPMQYSESLSLYLAFRDMPILILDSAGLWGTMVHQHATSMWAQKVGYQQKAAQAIGKADEAVDGRYGTGGKGPVWNQSYHFNRNIKGGSDTRMIHYSQHFVRAKIACLPPMDDPEKAAQELGTALHPYQDIEAHGDFGFKESYITTYHNSESPQTNLLGTYGDQRHYPDDPDLDTIGPIQYITKTLTNPGFPGVLPITSKVVYDYYTYVPGHNRYEATRIKTIETLKEYYWFVQSRGGCKCKKYFGVE